MGKFEYLSMDTMNWQRMAYLSEIWLRAWLMQNYWKIILISRKVRVYWF